jgi:hypothetical protein
MHLSHRLCRIDEYFPACAVDRGAYALLLLPRNRCQLVHRMFMLILTLIFMWISFSWHDSCIFLCMYAGAGAGLCAEMSNAFFLI